MNTFYEEFFVGGVGSGNVHWQRGGRRPLTGQRKAIIFEAGN